MDGGTSCAVIEILVQKLMKTFKEELSLIRGVDEDAQQLQMTLVMIQGYLNNAQNYSTKDDVKTWLRELEAVAFGADDVLDELSYHLLHNKVNKMKTLVDKDKVLSSLNHIGRPRNTAPKIKQINTPFDSMNKKAIGSGLESVVVNAPAPAATFDTDSFNCDSIFIGRDDDVTMLVGNLIQIPQEQIFSILAIVGADGMGKTTLTRKVFNHENLKARFGLYIWVHVSRIFDPVMLFETILSMLTSETTDGVETEESILKKLQQALKAKTYLLVLDNVRNEDDRNGGFPKWKDFINSISGVTSTKGNVIMITTENNKVASIVNPFHIHHLNALSHEDCWSIIKTKTFENGDCPSGFEIIGRMIAERCQGLPLAANVVGGALWGRDWFSIEEKCFPEVERYHGLDLLRFSFDSWSSPSLKMCFAYCSIFPKGHRIVRHELIELWMAEGFLQPDQRNDMESIGNTLFNVLLRNSLLLIAERDAYGNVESCVMHDLVHDLASSVLGSSDDINQVRYLFDGAIAKEAAKNLRTLIFQGAITDTTMFSSFKSLHALTLNCDQVTELPSSISKLIYLRHLNISRTQIECLPDWICELCYLQTLNAFTESLRELPSTFKYLISLRHLYIQSGVKLPPEIGALTNLQALKFRVGEEKGYRIEELGSLDNLKQLYIENLEKVRDSEEAKKAKLSEKQNLMELQLEWGENGEGERNSEPLKIKKDRNDEAVLEGLQPHPDLERLKIIGFKGKSFSSWTQKMEVGDHESSLIGLDKLIEITLSRCQGCEAIPILGHLPNLKSLSLRRLSNLRSIDPSFYEIANSSARVIFPALESILFSDIPELREWGRGKLANEVKVFPCLQSLKMYYCKNLECLPSWLFSEAHNLKELDIRQCSKLSKLPDGLNTLDFLESMTIKGCQNLKSIVDPASGGSLPSLRSLEIRDCQELMEMVESSVMPLLQKVSMVDLKSLQNLPGFLDCLAESPLLAQLTIVGVPKFISTPGVKIWPFCRLRKLEMDVSRDWSEETSVAIRETVNGILGSCSSSLGELNLTGIEIWKCLPKSIQHLTVLYSLELENFGVEELPEWFGDLSSLTRLCLSDCTKLRGLPSVQRLTSLQELHIRDCPELRIESERHKIFHRTFIYINGHQL
ncbi:disease resistance protein RGA2-like [Salvia miltiorrhiza]|uniref:disease resistance protein RGA2-like n=1 Tax=Salvia miltiorrhiza TaxID=226208 RepID=UPI0025AC74AA|nr:disease resistance protein RGA2-like [Salvia miltiorrhiza]XP_057772129.1 disease resistance protein RGA2-like [Salvia miltiorrhiza]